MAVDYILFAVVCAVIFSLFAGDVRDAFLSVFAEPDGRCGWRWKARWMRKLSGQR